MEIEWDEQWGRQEPRKGEAGDRDEGLPVEKIALRLDALLPADGETGAVSPDSLRLYLNAMMEMVARHEQPLTLLCVAADDGPALRLFGDEGTWLIQRAVARCLRQETRLQDVVGRADQTDIPAFLIVCPLLDETRGVRLSERVRAAMRAHARDGERPLLTVSAGVASMSLDVSEPSALIARAWDALRRARRAGGDRTWPYSETLRRLRESDE